jgi:hypothetical protein
MEKSDAELVREIEATIREHLAAIKNDAHVRIMMLSGIDRDKAWEEVTSAVDDYGRDMVVDATHWLRQQVNDYASRRWASAVSTEKSRR